jgi:hypothetical protein
MHRPDPDLSLRQINVQRFQPLGGDAHLLELLRQCPSCDGRRQDEHTDRQHAGDHPAHEGHADPSWSQAGTGTGAR